MDPHEEGYEDFLSGGTFWENPYDPVTEPEAALAWERGFREAQQENSQHGVGA